MLITAQDATLATYAGYTEQEIEPVFKLMVDYLHGPVQHDAFFRKYASKKFLKGMFLEPIIISSLANILQPLSSFASGPRSSPPCTSSTAIATVVQPLKSRTLRVFLWLLSAFLCGSPCQAPNDHLVFSTCFTHGPAFLDLRHFAPQMAWRSRCSKRVSILDNVVILHQLHHVHTQQETTFTSSTVLLFLFLFTKHRVQI